MNNQLQTIEIPEKGFISYNQYQWTMPKTVTLPGGSKKEFEYDALMQVKRITAKDPGQNTIMDYNYTRDKVGNILSKDSLHGLSGQSSSYSYIYDKTYQLLKTIYPDNKSEEFVYDPAGNRLTQHSVISNEERNLSYTHNANNEMLTAGSTSFEFDANGSMTKKIEGANVFEYVYNVENRLSQVKLNGNKIAEYSYDPFGRRISKEVAGVKTYYFYSDEGLTAEANASGEIVKTYGYVPNSFWSINPLWIKEGGQYYFYQNDDLNSPNKIISSNGSTVWQADYESFGKASVKINTIENNLRFPGQYYDQETGEHYNWNRTYMPEIGRYSQIDPMGFRSGDTNLYNYARNIPVSLIDPVGLSSCKDDAGRCCECSLIKKVELRFDTSDAVGHTFISTPNQTTGFYPDASSGGMFNYLVGFFFPLYVSGGTMDNSNHIYNKNLTIHYKACPDTLKKLEDAMDNRQRWRYSLGNFIGGWNCTGWAFSRLEAAGIKPPLPSSTPHLAPYDAWIFRYNLHNAVGVDSAPTTSAQYKG